MADAICPICGKVYDVGGGQNRWAVEGLFLKHKDACTVPDEGEFIRVVSAVVRVLSVDRESEEFPLVEVEFPSGRKGVYRLGSLGRVRDQAKAATRFHGIMTESDEGSDDP